jgi:thymidine phosphorylase
VIEGEPLLTLHVNRKDRLSEAEALLRAAIAIAPEAKPRAPLIQAVLG